MKAILNHLKIAAQEAIAERTYEKDPSNRIYRDHSYILRDWMKGTSGPALRNVIMSRDSGVSDVAIEKVMSSDFGRINLNEYKTIIDALIEFSPDRLGEGDLGGFSMRKSSPSSAT